MIILVLFVLFVMFKLDTTYAGTVPATIFVADDTINFRNGSMVAELNQSFKKKHSDSGAGENEIAEVRLNYNYNNNENFTAWKDEPLKIILENAYPRHVWCSSYYVNGIPFHEVFVPHKEFADNIVVVLNITKVTAEMSTRWACTVLQEYHGGKRYPFMGRNYTAESFLFNLHVKGRRQVILTANDHKLNYDVRINPSVGYYGLAKYTYRDGEDLDFFCRMAQNKAHLSDSLRLEYFNAEGILLFTTEDFRREELIPNGAKDYKFQTVLNATNDRYYLDCICVSKSPNRENRYRTIFYMGKDAEEHSIKLSINGQKLATYVNNDTLVDDYKFRYIEGEMLNVTCQKIHSFTKGTILFDRSLIYKEDRHEEIGIVSLRLTASKIQNKTVACSLNNTNVFVPKPAARVFFSSDIPVNGVRIRGLPRNNILCQYTNNLQKWRIVYQYSLNDALNLTCVAKSTIFDLGFRNSPLFLWTFEGKSIESKANWTQDFPVLKTSGTFTRILKARHNGSEITCAYFPKRVTYMNNHEFKTTVEIILRLKSEQNDMEKPDNDKDYIEKDLDIEMIVPITVTFGVAVAVITILCIICWHKRAKRVNLLENAYDHLSNQNDSPIPAFPTQWDSNSDDSHYATIDEEVMQENYNYSTDEDSLCKMRYNRASNISENHYTEIDNYFKPDGLTGQASNNKPTSVLKGTASYNSNNAIYNNPQDTYDKLMHNYLPIIKGNENYSNVQSKGRNKSVTFRQMSDDSRKYIDDNCRQDYRNDDQRLKQNYNGQYVNTEQNIYKLPGDQTEPYYENNFLKNKKADDLSDLDYAEPYGDLDIHFKKDFKY